MDPIYERPQDYDLEHEGDEKDIRFYERLVKRLRPRRALELASGSGRVAIRLARLASRLGRAAAPCSPPRGRAAGRGGVNRRHPALSGLAADAMGRGEGGMRSVYVSIDI